VFEEVAAKHAAMDGVQFESEIREQPAVLRRIAARDDARRLAAAIGERDVLFIGSGSSLFVAQLAMLAWRRAGRHADALAASEALFQAGVQRGRCVVALSQSGRTADVLTALDALAPAQTIALTNDVESPLALRADVVIDIGAEIERAVPATKSVTAMTALLLWAAMPDVAASALDAAATCIEIWLAGALPEMEDAAALVGAARSIVVIGAGFGVPLAAEIALKIKEATYRHAEGCSAGEFRHGSTALLDASRALIGIVDGWSRPSVTRVFNVAAEAGSIVATIGEAIPGVARFGPQLDGPFAPLAAIVAGQVLALALARAAGIDSDTPRGLRKFLG
jgi:glucosamine--fructose-6-phosphate aminotransferase (isomerizing)